MSATTLFDTEYEKQKRDLLEQVLERLLPVFSTDELEALRIDPVNPAILSQRSGRGFVDRDILETVLGNLLECVAPGSHNALEPTYKRADLRESLGEVADQIYAMIAQSFLAVGEDEQVEDKALAATYSLLSDLPRLKERAMWNRFASLKDPAVWDSYLRDKCCVALEELVTIDFGSRLDKAIEERDIECYRDFLKGFECQSIFAYQMQLVMSTYPGWRVLFYHDVAHGLTGVAETSAGLQGVAVPLLPRAISELGGRYYQADLHPETKIGDANFLDHPHRGLTTGQTGVIGSGCHLLPCTMGGLSRKLGQRHPVIGDYVLIGTDADLFGPVRVGDHSVIGPSTEIYGLVEMGAHCHIGSSVVIGTVKVGDAKPGRVVIGSAVRIGDGTIVENRSHLDLVIPEHSEIPARSHITNDGCGKPRFVHG